MQHVRISPKGRKVLNDKALAIRLVETIQANKSALSEGETIKVPGSEISVRFVTSKK